MNISNLIQNKRNRGLLIAAAAIYGFYRFAKMPADQKKDLVAKGKDLFNKGLGGLRDSMTRTKSPVAENGF
jgi:hypothetical protein